MRFPACAKVPSARVTVFPGQLPVCCRSPVSALNTVLLPVLGLPANATTKFQLSMATPSFSRFATLWTGHAAQPALVAPAVGVLIGRYLALLLTQPSFHVSRRSRNRRGH